MTTLLACLLRLSFKFETYTTESEESLQDTIHEQHGIVFQTFLVDSFHDVVECCNDSIPNRYNIRLQFQLNIESSVSRS